MYGEILEIIRFLMGYITLVIYYITLVKKYWNEDEEEWNVLFKMIHSNIVEINDIGKYFR